MWPSDRPTTSSASCSRTSSPAPTAGSSSPPSLSSPWSRRSWRTEPGSGSWTGRSRRSPPRTYRRSAGPLLVVLSVVGLLALGLAAQSCGPRTSRRSSTSSYQGTARDRAGPLELTYRAPDDQLLRPPPEARAEALRRTLLTLDAYRVAYDWEPALTELRVYPGTERGLACGPGSSGCAYPGGPLLVGGDVGALFHELHHLHRWSLGDPEWTQHAAPHWAPVWAWRPLW